MQIVSLILKFVTFSIKKSLKFGSPQFQVLNLGPLLGALTAPPTAVSEQSSDSKDVNNCLELSTRACILIFNDNFALAKSFPKTRTDAHTKAAAPVPVETSTNGT